ncbi:MAG: MFS transporter [Solirubrobacterales bacterium]|nr:MFS transporter [Solirubrobacterales bacterium]
MPRSPSPHRARGALVPARRDSRLLVGAVGVSALGDFLLWIPLTLHVQEQTGSGLAVAGLFIALWAPLVLLAPVAGLLVDRAEARGVLLASALVQLAAAAALAAALGSTAAILGLAAVLGAGNAIAQPAEFSLVPVIARGEDLRRLNGHVETARYTGMTLGPLLGGVLAGFGGTEIAMLANAATFAALAAAALLLHARRRPDPAATGHDRARDGLVHLAADGTLRLAVGVVVASLVVMTATPAAEVFFIKEELDASDLAYGAFFAAWTLGMVGGALVVARRVPAALVATGALVAVAVQGAGIALPTAWPTIGAAAALAVVGGLGHGTKNVLMRVLIQERVPDHLHGRAFAAYNGLRNGAELIALAGGGVLIAALGGRATLALAGGLSVLAALAGLALQRRVGLLSPRLRPLAQGGGAA